MAAKIVLEGPLHPAIRVGMGTFGVGIAVIAFLELWPGIWPLSFISPFFAALLLGGLWVCGFSVAAALTGSQETWTLRDHELVVDQRSPVHAKTVRLRHGNIHSATVVARDSDGEVSGWYVVLRATGDRTFRSPEFMDEERAHEFAAELSSRLEFRHR